ncbi:ATP-grasp domain-containing protein [Lactobacillus sp. S2-2]|uniref:ATP-grasp domain-containing protein n=1 Tax=Lactobacillus sp. S2-2 TaxID=2692917 RepID=UPI001F440F6F|nr:ATP-grasp domain-containing protein [Lactobacillus sp. S2-2]MCF6514802.1 ATP-grasp domain-containing protein [Lactobacillus sp. S2-2]
MNIKTIGIIGNNATNYNFAQSLIKNGYQIYFYLTDADSRLEKISNEVTIGKISDQKKLEEFADKCDTVIFNTRIINSEILSNLKEKTFLPQKTDLIDLSDDRLLLNAFLDNLNVNFYPYSTIVYLEDIYDEIKKIGYPAILKTNHPNDYNYDFEIKDEADIPHASKLLEKDVCVLEPYFSKKKYYEQTIIKSDDGSLQLMPINHLNFKNQKIDSIESIDNLESDTKNEIQKTSNKIATAIDYTGLLSIVFFVTDQGFIYINRLKYDFDLSSIIYKDSVKIDIFNQIIRSIQNYDLKEKSELLDISLIPFEKITKSDFISKNQNFDFHFEYQDRFNQGYYLINHSE